MELHKFKRTRLINIFLTCIIIMELSLINTNNKNIVEKQEIIKQKIKTIKTIIINVDNTPIIKQTRDKIFCNLG